jgi:hypothetical protein
MDEMKGFDERYSMGIDNDLWLRISVGYEFFYLTKPLAYYRKWAGQMSKKKGERLENFFRIFSNFLADNPGVVSGAERRQALAHTLVTRGRWHAVEKRRIAALRDYFSAFRQRPHDKRMWKQMAKLALGLSDS